MSGPSPLVKGQVKTSVFPAFNANYKTRRRTFRCCRNCRAKRARCVLSDNYEKYGCDDCRTRKLNCDLISVNPTTPIVPTPIELPVIKDMHIKPKSEESTMPWGFENSNNFTWSSLPQTESPVYPKRESIEHKPWPENGHNQSFEPKPASFPQLPTELPFSADLSTRSFTDPNLQPLLDTFDPSVLAGKPPISLDFGIPDSFTPSKPDASDAIPNLNGPIRPNSVFSSPPVLSPENVDSIIHKVDWRLLKRVFDFNTSIKETAVYLTKSLSRKETTDTKRVTLTEVLSRKHRNKRRFLSSRNTPHFKYLLSIQAFTLNSPGFFEVTQSDLLKLFEIYFYKINSIFPIVHEKEFWELYKKNKVPNIMVYAIVILSARDDMAIPILQRSLRPNGNLFQENQNKLIYELEAKVRQLLLFLPELEDTEKLTRLTTQLLLSLNFTFNKFGNEQSSHDLFDCISYAFSLLFHHDFFHRRLIKEGAEKKSVYLQHLWWVIFIFDRYNALLNGKAVVIKRSDFNISRPEALPHLDRLVSLAYALEDTLIAAFRPSRIIKGKETVIMETLPGDPVFKSSKLLRDYDKISTRIEELRGILHDSNVGRATKIGCLPEMPVATYRERHVLFLEEIIKTHLGLILRTGHLKCLRNCDEIDEPSLKFSQSFLDLLDMLKNGQGYELVMPIPLIPLILLVGLSVPLTSRMRMASKLKGIPSDSHGYRKMVEIGDLCDKYIKEFEILGQKWWFVHEVMESIEGFNRKANNTFSSQPQKKKGSRDSKSSCRDKLSINSLVTSEGSGIPAHSSMTSPGFYDEVIDDDEGDEEESDSGCASEDDATYRDALLYHLLVPPAMSMSAESAAPTVVIEEPAPTEAVSEQPASQPASVLLLSSNEVSPFGNQFQFVNDNARWDREFLAEQFDDDTKFFPNILHYFSEQPMP